MAQGMKFVSGIFLVILVFTTSLISLDFHQQDSSASFSRDQVVGVKASERQSKVFELKNHQVFAVQVVKENVQRTLAPFSFLQIQDVFIFTKSLLSEQQSLFVTIFHTISIRKLIYPSHFFW